MKRDFRPVTLGHCIDDMLGDPQSVFDDKEDVYGAAVKDKGGTERSRETSETQAPRATSNTTCPRSTRTTITRSRLATRSIRLFVKSLGIRPTQLDVSKPGRGIANLETCFDSGAVRSEMVGERDFHHSLVLPERSEAASKHYMQSKERGATMAKSNAKRKPDCGEHRNSQRTDASSSPSRALLWEDGPTRIGNHIVFDLFVCCWNLGGLLDVGESRQEHACRLLAYPICSLCGSHGASSG